MLVIEKDAVFQRLTEDRLAERLPCVLVTAKGMPDLGTRCGLLAAAGGGGGEFLVAVQLTAGGVPHHGGQHACHLAARLIIITPPHCHFCCSLTVAKLHTASLQRITLPTHLPPPATPAATTLCNPHHPHHCTSCQGVPGQAARRLPCPAAAGAGRLEPQRCCHPGHLQVWQPEYGTGGAQVGAGV